MRVKKAGNSLNNNYKYYVMLTYEAHRSTHSTFSQCRADSRAADSTGAVSVIILYSRNIGGELPCDDAFLSPDKVTETAERWPVKKPALYTVQHYSHLSTVRYLAARTTD